MSSLVAVTKRLIQPAPEDRYASAEEALNDLQTRLNEANQRLKAATEAQHETQKRIVKNVGVYAPVTGSRVGISMDEEGLLKIRVPPSLLGFRYYLLDTFFGLCVGAAALKLTTYWASNWETLDNGRWVLPLLFIPAWAVGLRYLRYPLRAVAERTNLLIGPYTTDIRTYLFGVRRSRVVGSTADLYEPKIETLETVWARPYDPNPEALKLQQGIVNHLLALGLTDTERQLIKAQINLYLKEFNKSRNN
mmetsp:Transcript_1472/g.3958  ORF Transcript_1472/g.3958 Transcript_1472/m.3958 type:complete len:249 (+) Transcript_1472:816-1562(+)